MTVSIEEPLELRTRDPITDSPAARALDGILQRAVLAGASDIHFAPLPEGARIRQRVDGVLSDCGALSRDLYARVASRMKLLSGMNIAEHRLPQDGRYTVHMTGRRVDLRLSSMPGTEGETLVVRILDLDGHPPVLEDLGIPEPMLRPLRDHIQRPFGFVVVVGPTGSGKTTTLYAALMQRHLETQNICTVEDPVEVSLRGTTQVQINPKAGLTFACATRGFLRQDPDILMIGEMRDAETARIATAAALSGQMILTSMHASDACTALQRLIEFGVSRETIASTVSLVIAQRLLRKACQYCHSAGCEECAKSGYRGRMALFEFLFLDQILRQRIAEGASMIDVREAAVQNGYVPIAESAGSLLRAGFVTKDETVRVVGIAS